jgi:gluconokinase
LNDSDRKPWLLSISSFISKNENDSLVFACSVLKKIYRDWIMSECVNINFVFIHLIGKFNLIEERLKKRTNHFMNPNLLRSQFETLELADNKERESRKFIDIDINMSIKEIIEEIKLQLNL